MSDSNVGGPVISLVTTRSDADVATDLKSRRLTAVEPLCRLIEEANAQGFVVEWKDIAPGVARRSARSSRRWRTLETLGL